MSTSSTAPAAGKDHRLKPSEYIGYALGDTASNFFFQMFNVFLTYYYVDVWGIPATVLLWMFPLTRLLDAFTDPVMGLIADRTKTRWGRFRPYLLWGALPYGLCGYLMFSGPDLPETGKVWYAFITYNLMLLMYTLINVPYSSLMGVLSPSSATRAVASSFRFVGAFTGGFLINLMVRPLVKYIGDSGATAAETQAAATNRAIKTQIEMHGFQWTIAIFAVISVAMFVICFATTKERVEPPAHQKSNVMGELGELVRNWPWIMLLVAAVFSTTFVALRAGSTIFYFKYVAKDDGAALFTLGQIKFDRTTIFLSIGSLAQIAGTVALGFVVRWLDKKNAAAFLSAVTGVCFLAFFFLPPDQYWLLVAVNAIGYMAMGPTSALTWALYGDVADYGEWKFGRRSTGLVFSASLFAIKTGVVVGGFILPLFLSLFGYVKDAVQTPRAILGISLAFSVVAGGFALLKAAALFIYPLNQARVNEIERELEARRAGLSAGPAQPGGFPIQTPPDDKPGA
jgi:GPH family glycoside/pentoside/hexuronide:cation symporter